MRRPGQRGITLLEIMVVLAIIGLIAYFVGVGVVRVLKSDLRTDAGRLAGAFRSAYNRAAASGSYHRVIVNLDEQSFRVERCEGKLVLKRATKQEDEDARIEEERKAAEKLMKDGQQGVVATATANAGENVGGGAGEAGTACQPVQGEMGKSQKLHKDRGIAVTRLYVSHLDQPATAGKVNINFFPMGGSERAVAEVANADGDVYSVVVHPGSGRVEIKQGALSRPGDFTTTDAEGNQAQ